MSAQPQPHRIWYKWAVESFYHNVNGQNVQGKKVYLEIYDGPGPGVFPTPVGEQQISWMVTASRQDKAMYDDAKKTSDPTDFSTSFSQIRTVDNTFGSFEKLIWNPRHFKEPPLDLSGKPTL